MFSSSLMNVSIYPRQCERMIWSVHLHDCDVFVFRCYSAGDPSAVLMEIILLLMGLQLTT